MEFLQNLQNWSETQVPDYTERLCEMVRIPSISGLKEHREDLNRMAELARKTLEEFGLKSEVVPTPGFPAVVGTLEHNPKAPWVTIYNHMDVQPAREPQWKTSPFEPLVKDRIVIGRGSTDDKGPALSILYALRYLKENGIEFPNVQVIYETEEEIGSPNFGAFLDQNQSLLKTPESILISDTIFEGEHPAVTYKLKGMLRMEASLKSGSKELHSGLFGGGIENPLSILVSALSTCVNARGELTIDEILAMGQGLSLEEQKALVDVSNIFDLEKFTRDSGEVRRYTEDPNELLARIWHKPTFEIHGFEGAQYEPHVLKSSIPPEVKAKISMRLTPGMEPEAVTQAVARHLKQIHPEIEVRSLGGQKAGFTPLSDPFLQHAALACQDGFGRRPVFVGCGGTIGAIPQFQRVWPNRAVVLIAQSLMSDGYHAPNEQFELRQGQRGMVAIASYLHRIARASLSS